MAICVIGGGFAGLTAAIRIKGARPCLDVLLVEKRVPESNTQIAGMRLRAGIGHQRVDPVAEIAGLLASRNAGVVTQPMKLLAETVVAELNYWHQLPSFVGCEDRPEWFGPQWGIANRAGRGHGKSVLNWLRAQASARGVRIVWGEVQQLKLTLTGTSVDAILVAADRTRSSEAVSFSVRADVYVLAAGSSGGGLFLSTNKQIRHSSQELAYTAGLPLIDSTIHMIHPFGNCKSDGTPLINCYETDRLAGANVYTGVSAGRKHLHQLSSGLLVRHEAHNHFPELVREFNRQGGVVQLEFPDGSAKVARVSHHYHHLGVETVDGVRVAGLDNLYAAGDASGLGHWTNHKERFPGFALVKSLVDAALIAQSVCEMISALSRAAVTIEHVRERCGARRRAEQTGESGVGLRRVNSGYLADLFGSPDPAARYAVAAAWMKALCDIAHRHGWTSLLEIALGMAYAHREVSAGRSAEPLRIDRRLVRQLRTEQAGLGCV
ncbi:MAG: FAD-dependent oxidoreductase [Egibacteraceae bacterium]